MKGSVTLSCLALLLVSGCQPKALASSPALPRSSSEQRRLEEVDQRLEQLQLYIENQQTLGERYLINDDFLRHRRSVQRVESLQEEARSLQLERQRLLNSH